MIRMIGVGDNVVDRYPQRGVLYPGGNSINFAVYGKQLGHETAYMGVLADDREGEIIQSALKSLGVDIAQSAFVHGETGRCTTTLTDGDRCITDDNDFGAVKSQPLQLTPERLDYIANFHVAHSSCYSFIENQLHLIRERGVPVVYDFSDVWTEKDFDQICPNIDIAFFSGKKLPDETLHTLLKKTVSLGCSLAISTIGRRGAVVDDGTRFYTKAPYNPQGKVVDTLGAGDSFLTGFISTYYEGLERYRSLCGTLDQPCTTPEDDLDYRAQLIEYAMSEGNLLAIRNCMVRGAFGCAQQLED